MRRFWFVPLLVLAFFLFVNPRQAGYTTPARQPAVSDRSPAPIATTVPTVTAGPTDRPAPSPSTQPTGLTAPSTPVPATPVPARRAPAAPSPTQEPPALEPQVAPPTPVAQAPPVANASQPVRIVIPDIELDLQPVAVGLDEQRIPIVPKHDVGWYDRSAMPGQGSNVVFWGHVLRWLDTPDIPAPFARVHELQPGAPILITTADGQVRQYRVTNQVQVRPEDVGYVLPTETERVTLVSCIGDKVIQEGVLTKEFRLITIAEPAE